MRTTTRLQGLRLALIATLLPLGACMATVGVNNVSIPKDAAQTCARHCDSIGLQLSAVAIMAENVGCVCQAASASKAEGNAGALTTPAAGMATIAAQQAAAAVVAAQASQRAQQQRARAYK